MLILKNISYLVDKVMYAMNHIDISALTKVLVSKFGLQVNYRLESKYNESRQEKSFP